MSVFVLGNGRSRQKIDPNRLKELGTVYGCNALYRDCVPDVLIAVDVKMILELNENNIQHKTQVWTNYNKQFQQMQGFNYFQPSKGWSSGPTALWHASVNLKDNKNIANKIIYVLGFDYIGIDDRFFNNIYADTKNYKKSTDPATFFGNWKKQTETVMKEFTDITYYRVKDSESVDFDWNTLPNYQSINTIDFFKKINF